jgi:hypothetical protein
MGKSIKQLSKEVQIANKCRKNVFIILSHKGYARTLRFHLTQSEWPSLRNTQQMLARMWRKRNPCILLLEM